MNCLAIDTTNTKLTVVLLKDDEVFHREIEVGKSGHSRLLMPTVDEVLKESKTSIQEIDSVAAVVGPGSFTGIRIGVSAMTAIAFANDAKRISVTSFELIAYNCANVIAVVDAGHGNAYCAECENGEAVSTRFIGADETKHLPKYVKTAPDVESWKALAGVVKNKLAKCCFQPVLTPYYMRKSQAEREKDDV
ncbi:MAG: tRNA (adenosine(37)-N6)-threonylcarbamoyltransferase complex dimerization subunit type 1 TsaB [Bacteroides sp.]|nr:tRNA (adenosine(37)-N6)-threonylcarbamoyltransferase complex dimerization subunit type 1 TsaB [Bacillota bacterium]MCM1393442.1 tRNA (adenosine(37)-N6)-threonylcarbamoyltransferase complex dimerization subunit type 1 TsaB [[Eubacterium] siraeum]MCM1455058.1 tRNA (adenosine(37)-N6)-threonylcarbamoyltransferase complex dimerization subunit type 1 TsaB [Bacteroides sp.]